jgi:hypothetical protein
MEAERAERFAQEWFEAWNAHDLERILIHYRDDVRYQSPMIPGITGESSGKLVGKPNLQSYFELALQAYPALVFQPISISIGLDSVVLHYRSVNNRIASEVFVLDESGLAREVLCHYNPG